MSKHKEKDWLKLLTEQAAYLLGDGELGGRHGARQMGWLAYTMS